jgi:hypothetical protein
MASPAAPTAAAAAAADPRHDGGAPTDASDGGGSRSDSDGPAPARRPQVGGLDACGGARPRPKRAEAPAAAPRPLAR